MARHARRRRPARRAPDQPPPDPAARRPRDLPRHPRPVARLPRPLGRERAACCSALRSRPSSARWTTSAGSSPPVKLVGQFVAASIPCMFGVWIDHVTFPFLGVARHPGLDRRAAVDRLHRRRDEHGQLPRRDGRARGGCLRHRRSRPTRSSPSRSGSPIRRSSRRSSRVPASGSCATTSSRRGSSWATRARSASGSSSRRSPSRAC